MAEGEKWWCSRVCNARTISTADLKIKCLYREKWRVAVNLVNKYLGL